MISQNSIFNLIIERLKSESIAVDLLAARRNIPEWWVLQPQLFVGSEH